MESTPNAEGQADRCAETKNVGDEMREAIACVGEHCCAGVLKDEADGAVRENDPSEKGKAESPDESGASTRGATREESAERHAEERAVDQRLSDETCEWRRLSALRRRRR